MRVTFAAYLVSCVVAAALPVVLRAGYLSVPASVNQEVPFPGWPASFQGKPITQVPLLPREARFYEDFEGKIARFTDTERQIVVRWMPTKSPQFHMTTRCFRAIGYELSPLPAFRDEQGEMWGTFRAVRNGTYLNVHERIVDAAGQSWIDESAWRWDLFWRRTEGPWWAYTVATRPTTR